MFCIEISLGGSVRRVINTNTIHLLLLPSVNMYNSQTESTGGEVINQSDPSFQDISTHCIQAGGRGQA